MYKIKPRNEILNDVIKDGKKYPNNWKAVFGKDNKLLSTDYYLFNPDIGIYLLKEFEKNPFEVKGIGGKIARHLDEDLESEISKYAGDFGIMQGDFKKILKNLDKGINPEKIFKAALKGNKDFGLTMPVRGQVSTSKVIFENIYNNFSEKQKKIDEKFQKIASDEGLYKAYD
jgi:hypothetical protein